VLPRIELWFLVGGRVGLVQEHEPGPIETWLLCSPPRSRGGRVGAITIPPIVISRAVEVIE